jgi:endonuclease/exonuclease/phosphatase family metal-dependent hydrolase
MWMGARGVRVATFNLLHGRSVDDGSTDPAVLGAAAATLDADIVGLQEVDRHLARSGEADQPEVVAAALGAAHVRFVPTLTGNPERPGRWRPVAEGGQLEAGQYGIALVSRYPLRAGRVLLFPAAPIALPLFVPGRRLLTRVPDEPRAAFAAIAETPYGEITVVTTHLSFLPGWNVRQLRTIVGWVRDLPKPQLLLGDLNIPGPLPASVSGWRQLARAATYPAPRPAVQFDHVLGRAIGRDAVAGVASLRLPVSDHRALCVDLVLDAISDVSTARRWNSYPRRHP